MPLQRSLKRISVTRCPRSHNLIKDLDISTSPFRPQAIRHVGDALAEMQPGDLLAYLLPAW